MKELLRRKKLLLMTSLVCLTYFACSDKHNFVEDAQSKIETEIPELLASIVVNCDGSCQAGDCRTIFDLNTQTMTCSPCSACKMVFENSNQNTDYEFVSDVQKIANMFVDYADRNHRTNLRSSVNNYKIDLLRIDAYEGYEFAKIDYHLSNDLSKQYSVAFLTDTNTMTSLTVDCDGDCGQGSSEICTEVFNLVTKEVYCKCESPGCKMTIEE